MCYCVKYAHRTLQFDLRPTIAQWVNLWHTTKPKIIILFRHNRMFPAHRTMEGYSFKFESVWVLRSRKDRPSATISTICARVVVRNTHSYLILFLSLRLEHDTTISVRNALAGKSSACVDLCFVFLRPENSLLAGVARLLSEDGRDDLQVFTSAFHAGPQHRAKT
jgi:hypothetical protein